jgi:hypothetical protein
LTSYSFNNLLFPWHTTPPSSPPLLALCIGLFPFVLLAWRHLLSAASSDPDRLKRYPVLSVLRA